jgi:hypothetical protein
MATSSMSDHERIGPLIQSHERKWTLEASEHEEAAEKARTKKHADIGMHINAPAEARGRMERTHDEAISRHERAARQCRRRAEHAAAGYVLHGPDEGSADYMRDHQELHDLARRTGRLRQTAEGLDA